MTPASFIFVFSFCYKLSDESYLDGQDQDAAGEKVSNTCIAPTFCAVTFILVRQDHMVLEVLARLQWKPQAPVTLVLEHSESPALLRPIGTSPTTQFTHLGLPTHANWREKKLLSGTAKRFCRCCMPHISPYFAPGICVTPSALFWGRGGEMCPRKMWPFKDPHLRLHQSQGWPSVIEVCKADLVTRLHKY